jgi:hypothetical protein
MSNLLTASPWVYSTGSLLFFRCSNILVHLARSRISIRKLEQPGAPHKLVEVLDIELQGAVSTPQSVLPDIPAGRIPDCNSGHGLGPGHIPDHNQLAAGDHRTVALAGHTRQLVAAAAGSRRLLGHPLRNENKGKRNSQHFETHLLEHLIDSSDLRPPAYG